MGVLILVGIQFMKVVTDHVIPASSKTQWDQSRVQRWMGAATEGMSVPPSLTICGAWRSDLVRDGTFVALEVNSS